MRSPEAKEAIARLRRGDRTEENVRLLFVALAKDLGVPVADTPGVRQCAGYCLDPELFSSLRAIVRHVEAELVYANLSDNELTKQERKVLKRGFGRDWVERYAGSRENGPANND